MQALHELDKSEVLNSIKYAYVSFKSNTGPDKAIKVFRESGKFGLCNFIKLDDKLKFEGSPLDVKTVCDPEFINWENLKATKG